MFALNETKIYGAKMKQKLDEKATGLTPVRNGKIAGATPAESTDISLVGRCDSLPKMFYTLSSN